MKQDNNETRKCNETQSTTGLSTSPASAGSLWKTGSPSPYGKQGEWVLSTQTENDNSTPIKAETLDPCTSPPPGQFGIPLSIMARLETKINGILENSPLIPKAEPMEAMDKLFTSHARSEEEDFSDPINSSRASAKKEKALLNASVEKCVSALQWQAAKMDLQLDRKSRRVGKECRL